MDKWDKSVPVEESSYLQKDNPQLTIRKLNKNPLTVVDLFCGAGGASHGFAIAGFNIILGIDFHKPSMESYLHNHMEASGILGDIRQVDAATVQKCINDTRVQVLIAGVPCQGFSLNNRKRRANDPRNFLFWEFMRFVEMLKPEILLLENVSGMKSTANGTFVREIEQQIRNVGIKIGKHYNVASRLLNAADYGVPQIRKRLIFLAFSGDREITWPVPRYGFFNQPHRNVRDAIGDLPPLSAGHSRNRYTRKAKTEYQKIMRNGSDIIWNHEAPNHPENTIQKIGSTQPGKPIYPRFTQRIRLSYDQPSPTQVAGGIRPQYQFGHPHDARGLTVRERARIQSFPDCYRFFGGVVQGRVQTGNAVPPLLAEAIAKEILKAIDTKKE